MPVRCCSSGAAVGFGFAAFESSGYAFSALFTPRGLSLTRMSPHLGTALLLAAIIGSGVAAQRHSPREVGLELLENAFATAAARPDWGQTAVMPVDVDQVRAPDSDA